MRISDWSSDVCSSDLLTGNIERIEIVRGSQSVLWGSQAIGGVINMITREPTKKLSFNARAEYGWRDTAQTVGNISGVFGPVAASLGAGYFRRSEEHTSELPYLLRISYAVLCLKKK